MVTGMSDLEKENIKNVSGHSPVTVIVVKSNGDLRVFCNSSNRINAQMNHPICDHVTDLNKAVIG